MKKRQNKSKVEVVEPVSVANQCDYQRSNGKCGRAMSDNFGKQFTGRSCEDWKCEAEGEEVEKAGGGGERKTISRCDGMRNDGTCGNGCSDNHNNKCRGAKCPDRFTHHAVVPASATQRDAAGTVAATVQPFNSSTLQPSYRDRVSGQYAAIETAKDNLLRECVKFGALLTEVGYYLGESRGGRHDGGGLKGWLAENCPEINYDTACGYKALATKCVKMLGGGSQAVAVLQDKTEVIPPGEDAPVEVESKFIEKRDNLFNEVKSRRELEQTYFKFMAHEGKGRQGGANKGQSGTGRRALTVEEQAKSASDEFREMIGSLFAYVVEQKKVTLLTEDEQDEFISSLKRITKNAEEMVEG